ncbi:hypothetical protein CAPTEDRAFT_50987, partial [Capitella teleta]
GFSFADDEDEVTCFFCGGSVYIWELHDDPWTEHARWHPKCNYIRQKKGDAFVQEVQSQHP